MSSTKLNVAVRGRFKQKTRHLTNTSVMSPRPGPSPRRVTPQASSTQQRLVPQRSSECRILRCRRGKGNERKGSRRLFFPLLILTCIHHCLVDLCFLISARYTATSGAWQKSDIFLCKFLSWASCNVVTIPPNFTTHTLLQVMRFAFVACACKGSASKQRNLQKCAQTGRLILVFLPCRQT